MSGLVSALTTGFSSAASLSYLLQLCTASLPVATRHTGLVSTVTCFSSAASVSALVLQHLSCFTSDLPLAAPHASRLHPQVFTAGGASKRITRERGAPLDPACRVPLIIQGAPLAPACSDAGCCALSARVSRSHLSRVSYTSSSRPHTLVAEGLIH